jgi:hypothetical protein
MQPVDADGVAFDVDALEAAPICKEHSEACLKQISLMVVVVVLS